MPATRKRTSRRPRTSSISIPSCGSDKVWSTSTKGGDDVLRLGLQPAVQGERVYVAGHGGDVRALELATGRDIWRASVDVELAGGPAVGEGVVVVGGSGGELVALDAETGAKRWQVATGGEVLTAPTVAAGIIVVRTVDGRLRGLRISDGGEAWVYEQPVPRLTLRGNGSPVVDGDMVFAGLDNGKVVALSLTTGELLWSATVAPLARPHRDSSGWWTSTRRCASSATMSSWSATRGASRCSRCDSGQVWWGRDMSSYRGLVAERDHALRHDGRQHGRCAAPSRRHGDLDARMPCCAAR